MTPDAAPARVLAPLETEYRPRRPLDLALTLAIQQHGGGDPAFRTAQGVIWRASRTPAGVAALALRQSPDGTVRAAAWGPGADHALDRVPRLCGADDDDSGFDAMRHPVVAATHRRFPGLRLSTGDELFDALVAAIFEQKVTGQQAFGAWRRILYRFGERAPGPTPRPMSAPPTIAGWRAIPSWAWHRAGLEPPQSRAVIAAAQRGESIVRASTDPVAADRVLRSLPGVGEWTSAETRLRAFGDPDAVSVGDFHLAHEVGFALTGRRTDDDGMLQLLEPWPGQRQRVVRLIRLSGRREPRRGPRLSPQDHRAI